VSANLGSDGIGAREIPPKRRHDVPEIPCHFDRILAERRISRTVNNNFNCFANESIVHVHQLIAKNGAGFEGSFTAPARPGEDDSSS